MGSYLNQTRSCVVGKEGGGSMRECAVESEGPDKDERGHNGVGHVVQWEHWQAGSTHRGPQQGCPLGVKQVPRDRCAIKSDDHNHKQG
jgi:hypothetical protein